MAKIIFNFSIIFLLLFSCKAKINSEKKERNDLVIKLLTKDSLPKEKDVFKIDTVNIREFSLPFGYSKVTTIKEKEPVFDNDNIYGNTLTKIRNDIKKIKFKDSITNYISFENLILKTKDSLNPVLYGSYFPSLEKKTFFLFQDYIKYNDYKLFFLKTRINRFAGDTRGIENLYLVSVKENTDTAIDIQNIYYHYIKVHSMTSRCFYIDKNLKISSAIYSNTEGEVLVENFKEFELDEKGYFKSL